MRPSVSELVFTELRPRLTRIAYRMLGSVADAEDILQDAYTRWHAVDITGVREPAALLHTIVTRLCLNELKTARRRRERYVGPWLPEPIVDLNEPDIADDVTMPLMLALERLSPLERAVFLLHDIFGMGFEDIAQAISRDPAACRQLASRARRHIRGTKPRFTVPKEYGLEIAAAFFAASRNGDLDTLCSLLAGDVVALSDGGGRVPASLVPLVGIGDVMARHVQLAGEFKKSPSLLIRYTLIDGLPGFISIEAGGIVQTTALQIVKNQIVAIYITRNPDKLRHLTEASFTA